MLVPIINRGDPDQMLLQKQSDPGLFCLSRPIRTSTVDKMFMYQDLYKFIAVSRSDWFFNYYSANKLLLRKCSLLLCLLHISNCTLGYFYHGSY